MHDHSMPAVPLARRAFHRWWFRLGLHSACLALLAGGFVSVASGQPSRPSTQPASRPARLHAGPQKLSGAVEYYNLGPNGMPGSLMLKTSDGVVQLDFPPTAAEAIAKAAPIGVEVQAMAIPTEWHPGDSGGRMGPGPRMRPAAARPDGAGTAKAPAADHRVLRLVSLTGADGKATDVATAAKPQPTNVDGTIKQLNYGPRGELNGVILDNGDFVQFGPEVSKVLKLAPGQKLIAEGHARPLPTGHRAIEADVINGMAVPHLPRGGPAAGRDSAKHFRPDPSRDERRGFGGPDGPRMHPQDSMRDGSGNHPQPFRPGQDRRAPIGPPDGFRNGPDRGPQMRPIPNRDGDPRGFGPGPSGSRRPGPGNLGPGMRHDGPGPGRDGEQHSDEFQGPGQSPGRGNFGPGPAGPANNGPQAGPDLRRHPRPPQDFQRGPAGEQRDGPNEDRDNDRRDPGRGPRPPAGPPRGDE